MTLATRCPACGTAFRVVEDQLKVSDGWVRCGRCGDVFSALEGLFDLARPPASGPAVVPEASTAATAKADASAVEGPTGDAAGHADDASDVRDVDDAQTTAEVADVADASSAAAAGVGPGSEGTLGPDAADATSGTGDGDADGERVDGGAGERPADRDAEIDAHLFGTRGQGARGPALALAERDRPDFSDARFDSEMADSAPFDAARGVEAAGPGGVTPEGAATPAFLRDGAVGARPVRPRVRAAWAAGVGALALALLLQAGHHWRDGASVRSSAAGALLGAWCAVAGCEIGAPRRIDDVSVDSTAFTKVNGSADSFRLTVGLRSRSTVPVALPSVDLTLTDGNGRPVARKVLGRDAFAPAARAIGPGAEVVLQTLLGTRDLKVAGYTVEIFYP